MISIGSSSILATLVCFQLSLGIICYGMSQVTRDMPGVRLIAASILSGSVGLFLIGSRQYLNANIWIIVGNGFYFLSLYMTWGGIRRLYGQSVPWPLLLLIVGLAGGLLAGLLLTGTSLQSRIILACLVSMLASILCGVELFRRARRPFSPIALLTIVGFTAEFLAQFARGLLAFLHEAQGPSLFDVSPLTATTLGVASLAHLIWNFSLIGLISELSHLNMYELANTDPLTGTANRRCLMDRLTRAFLPHDKVQQVTLLLIDLDHLKEINDRYGHETGDHILQLVSTEISLNLRRDDVLGRLGGDEFCVILQGMSGDEAVIVAERIRQQIAALQWPAKGTLISPTVSIGVLSIAPDANMTEALGEVDARLYSAKQTGRNRVVSILPPASGQRNIQD